MVRNNVFNSVKYVVLSVSTVCNLHCKHCITFTPYHRHPRFFDVDKMSTDMERFFRVFGQPLERLDLGGGEPLLHPNLLFLVEWVLKRQGKDFSQLRILTNGSQRISNALIELSKDRDVFFLLDDYGSELSPFVAENQELMEKHGIHYRINIYHGDKQYFDGWVDFGQLQFKNYTPEQLEHMRLNCFDIYSESSVCQNHPCDHLHIKDGIICYCDMQQVGARHIPVNEGDFINLRSIETDDALHARLKTFKTGLIETCKYCNGFMQLSEGRTTASHGNVRVPAAIQLTPEELRSSMLDCH